ncbi:MAG: hypothetical protein LC689_19955 [Myxococcales bacterium]|nr:hypothetical protein [Myxococcales bacterium]
MRIAAILMILAGCKAAMPAGRAVATTDGAIALGNLDAQIAGQERLLERERGSVMDAAALVELLQARAQYTGRIADYDRAAEAAEEAVRVAPHQADALLVRAGSRAALHRFPEALADANAALKLGADEVKVAGLRSSVFQAQGRLAEALALRRQAVRVHATTQSVGALAAAEAAIGDRAAAERDFDEAVRLYRDTSPFPLAWIDFQRGLLREKAGDLQGAHASYSAALLRLPQYAQAAAHLAALEAMEGSRARAVELLRPLASLDDPEYAGQLAALLPDSQGSALRESARARFEALLARHPQAFADHAARFFLARDPRRALELAVKNLEVRRTWEAFDLALTAASAAGVDGCEIASQALALPNPPRRIQFLAGRCRIAAAGP